MCKTKRSLFIYLIIGSLIVMESGFFQINAQLNEAKFGPKIGTLFLVGGSFNDVNIQSEFNRLIGGYKTRLVLIPTASREIDMANRLQDWLDLGYENVEIIHAKNSSEANSDSFANTITNADAVWFYGGSPYKLSDIYLNTKAHEAFAGILDRGGVIGGSSAGAMIQCEFDAFEMHRTTNKEFTSTFNQFFGFAKSIALVAHLDGRNYWDILNVGVRKYETVLGLGIPNGGAAVITQDTIRVFGKSIAIYNAQNEQTCHTHKCYEMFEPGTKYNIAERKEIVKTALPSPKINELKTTITYNSTNQTITISHLDGLTSGFLKILDLKGKKYISRSITSIKELELKTNQLPKGVYIVTYTSKIHNFTKKIMVN